MVSRRTRNRSPDVGQSSRVIDANDAMADLYTEIQSTGHQGRAHRPCVLCPTYKTLLLAKTLQAFPICIDRPGRVWASLPLAR
jgi:hypothetical protein